MSLLIFLLFSIFVSNGQTEYHFKNGLAVAQCHRYGREAIVMDQLAHQLYTGEFKKPVAGEKLFTNEQGTDLLWQNIEVDTAGRFKGDVLTNGYIYLTYQSDRSQNALLNISGNSMFYFNAEPHGGDIYNDGWMKIPVKLKKGINEILIRCGNFTRWQGISARLIFQEKPVLLSTEDVTLPHIVIGKSKEDLLGAVVIINASNKPLTKMSIRASLNDRITDTNIPDIGPATMHKTGFYFNPSNVSVKGDYTCTIQLRHNGKLLDEKSITVNAVNADDHHSYTFISGIDGSVQYYSVAPQSMVSTEKPALFLSVHGAGVQAIGQARAYQPKGWGVLVAPTNRRPRGFNWEDWGRIDALEVLELATKQFNPDPKKIFLTGHSMGGHGTWYLGATYPDKWAAIAPCAAYPTLTGYGSADGKIPEKGKSDADKILFRASNPSNVIELAQNYKNLGVYIHHGDSDKVVSVNYARQMRKVLGEFHSDFSYYEYPGGSHWFGDESVDWPPLFEFFQWHTIKHDSTQDLVDFITANPAISSKYRWASIIQQDSSLAYSKIHLVRDKKARTITGSTENIGMLKLETNCFNKGDTISITLDKEIIRYVVGGDRIVYLSKDPQWKIESSVNSNYKNELRSGTFKEAFNHKMIFVYGTAGNSDENKWAYNKARYDAEVWYYRGNGAVDLVADRDFTPGRYPDRGVIIYGNSITNSAWDKLLKGCPIKVTRDRIRVGSSEYSGKDLAAYFTWPRGDSNIALVGVITGTGLSGMNATDPNQYFAAGSGFPDYMIFSADMLKVGSKAIKAAGFYGNKWELANVVK
jgi:dienelactone hydrolase